MIQFLTYKIERDFSKLFGCALILIENGENITKGDAANYRCDNIYISANGF